MLTSMEGAKRCYQQCIDNNFFVVESYTNLLTISVFNEVTYRCNLYRKSNSNNKGTCTRIEEALLNCEDCDEYGKEYTMFEMGEGIDQLNSIHAHTIELMKMVKSFGNYDIVYFYIAILYLYNCMPEELDGSISVKIGRNIMKQLVNVENKYAKGFWSMFFS